VARWGEQAAQALEHTHQVGVVHRDVKPANLLVDGQGSLWITDFGLAHLPREVSLTLTGDLVGTLRYMSPEQALAKRVVVDHRTDVYSLGATLYEFLALRPAFGGSDRQELLRQIAFEEPRPPRRLNQAVPPELETIVLKALEKNPADRYATAQELADDLRRFLDDKPIRARRPTLRQRLTKWGRRHRGVVGTAVAGLVLAVVVLALSTAWVWKENQAKNAALGQAQQQREVAEKARGKALEAVQRMLTRVADERVAAIPQMKEVRRRLLEDAAALYTELIALNPDDARAYHERGWAHYLLDSLDQARTDFERAAELEPDNAEYHRTLATFFSEEGLTDAPRCLYHARRLMELMPNSAEAQAILAGAYLTAGQKKEGVAELRKAAQLARGTPLEHRLLAWAEYEVGNWRNVVGHLQQVRELPLHLNDCSVLATAHLALGEDAQALATVEQGLELALRLSDEPAGASQYRARFGGMGAPKPTSHRLAMLYTIRADIHLRRKQYAAALADLNNCIDLAGAIPSRSFTYKRRAVAHFHLKQFEQALADTARAVELRPDDHSNLTWISPELVASCPDEKFRAGMLALADKTIERTAHKAGGYYARGWLYAALKQHEKAMADFEKAVQLGVTHAGVLNNMAWYLATCPDPKFRDAAQAVTLGKKAVELAPTDGTIWNTLGAARYRNGDWQAAVEALQKSDELLDGAQLSFNAFFLAMAHWRLGDREQARTWYDRAIAWMDQHNPGDDELKRFRAEAAALLGVKDPPPRKGVAPSKP
jgi:tetratricopeptide (TPR) repeat protein